MNLNEYQELSKRTINADLSDSEKVKHATHGMWSEYGEIRGIYQKVYQGHKESDKTHLIKEIGDLMWFVSELATANSASLGGGVSLGKDYHGETPDQCLTKIALDMLDLELGCNPNRKKQMRSLVSSIYGYCLSEDIEFSEVLQMNVDKLKARYPEGFEAEKSLNRAEGDI